MHLRNTIPFLASTVASQTLTSVLAANNGTLSTLNSLLTVAPQLASALATGSNITILAPSNQAFASLIAKTPSVAAMTQNSTFVTNLLEYHVLSGVFTASKFTKTPIFATSVLVSGTINQKVELVKTTNTPLILSGYKQESLVSQPDILFNGGVLHIIDTVLSVPDTTSATALDTGLTSLAGALVKTNMVAGIDALQGVTIFAPSNSAFSAVGAVISGSDTELLSNVLDYHVVTGTVAHSNDLLNLAAANGGSVKLRSAQGGAITIRSENGQLFANSARITVADVLTSNGVVHVIDNVMNPLATTNLPDVSRATQLPVFAGASSLTNAPFTSGLAPATTLIPATVSANAYAALPTAALLGAFGAAAAMANL